MVRSFSFIHTSDLHLDSPFKGLCSLEEELGNLCKKSTFEAFNNIINEAINNDVDFVLFAGDIFDSENRSLAAQRDFYNGLSRLNEHGIKSFIAHGNHDPTNEWSKAFAFSKVAKEISSDKLEKIPVYNKNDELIAVIYGISFKQKAVNTNLTNLFPEKEEGVFSIGVLHCSVGSSNDHEPYAPCSLDDLKAKRYDYWALGHIHKTQILSENPSLIIYPGTPQGRSFKENGQKGCYLVKISSLGEIQKEFIATDYIRWVETTIDITNAETMDDFENILYQNISDIKANNGDTEALFLDLKIKGWSICHQYIVEDENPVSLINNLVQEEQSKPVVYVQKLVMESGLPVNIEELKTNDDFLGYLLRLIQESKNNKEINEKLYNEISALLENSTLKKYFFKETTSSENINSLLEKTKDRCIDLFCKEG